jgi:hypothetical protein
MSKFTIKIRKKYSSVDHTKAALLPFSSFKDKNIV